MTMNNVTYPASDPVIVSRGCDACSIERNDSDLEDIRRIDREHQSAAIADTRRDNAGTSIVNDE